MRIRLKLMGMLKENAPEGDSLELDDDASIRDALVALEIPVDAVQVFQVNGTLERDKSRVLTNNDELTILPPVGGG